MLLLWRQRILRPETALHVPMNTILSIVRLHIVVFALAMCLVEWSFARAAFAVLAYLISNALISLGQGFGTWMKVADARIAFFAVRDAYRLERLDLARVLSYLRLSAEDMGFMQRFGDMPRILRKRMLEMANRGTEFLRIYLVRRVEGKPVPEQLKAFVSYGGTSFVFVREHPSRLSACQKFLLLHEIGHVTFRGIRASLHRSVYPLLAGGTAIIVGSAALAVWGLSALVGLGIYIAERWFWFRRCVRYEQELYADAFAFAHLEPTEREEALRALRLVLRPTRGATAIGRARATCLAMNYSRTRRGANPVPWGAAVDLNLQSILFYPAIAVWVGMRAPTPGWPALMAATVSFVLLWVAGSFCWIQCHANERVVYNSIAEREAPVKTATD